MLNKVKNALRITTSVFDDELADLIEAAKADLNIAGVVFSDNIPPIVSTAIITYCKLHWGTPVDPDRLKASYDEQKAQLSMAEGFRYWEDEV